MATMQIVALKGINHAVLSALRMGEITRKQGKPTEITILAEGTRKPLLRITPGGDIEEILVPPMRVGMIDRVADKAVDGDAVQRRNAADFARRIIAMERRVIA